MARIESAATGGSLSWAPAKCPACGQRMGPGESPFPAGCTPIELCRCLKCGLVCGKPAVDTYDAEEYEYYGSLQGFTRDRLLDPLNRSRYLELLTDFGSLTDGRDLLDIGCGRGGFVEAAVSSGWNALGIELSETAVKLAASLGLPVQLKDLFDPSIRAGWNVIVMTEVIEHLPNPGDFISRAEKLLAPGGLLYLTTPCWDSVERRFLGARWDVIHREHLSYFSVKSIRKLVGHHSKLRIISLRTENVCLGKLLSTNAAPGNGGGSRMKVRDTARAHDQELRRRIYSNPALLVCKWAVNELLNCTRLGSTLKLVCQKA